MSHDELAGVRAAVRELAREVSQLQDRCCDSLGLRRLVSDVRRLEEDLAEFGEVVVRQELPMLVEEREMVPDSEYVSSAWGDCDDEGVGLSGRRAP